VYQGICELFEIYLVHVFIAFSDVSLAELLDSDSPDLVSSDSAKRDT
jgi:hypothetical protein